MPIVISNFIQPDALSSLSGSLYTDTPGILKFITASGSVSVVSGSDGVSLNISSSAIMSGSSSGSGLPVFISLQATNLQFSSITGSGGVSSSYSNGVITLSSSISPTFTQVQTAIANSTSPLTHNGQPLQLIGYPTASSDAASKQYVIDTAGGISNKPSVRVATTASLPSYNYVNGVNGIGATIVSVGFGAFSPQDGVNLSASDIDRVLIKNETGGNAPYNGIYTLTIQGSAITSFTLTRTLDSDTPAELEGASVFVATGSTNGGTQWFLPLDQESITIGTTALNFQQIPSFSNITFGPGLVKSGNTLNIAYGTVTGTVVQGNDARIVSSITGAINDGAGAGVYETTNALGLIFRSFIASGSISIGSGSNTISISSSYSNIQSLGSGQQVIQNVNASIISFKTITASGSSVVSSGSDAQTLNISSSFSNVQSLGSGQPIIQNVNAGIISFKTITGSGSVGVTSGSDAQTLNVSGAYPNQQNLGSGQGVLQNVNNGNVLFRSLTASGSVGVTSGSDGQTINISSSFSNVQNLGSGQQIIQNVNAGIISFKTITVSGTLAISSGSDGQTLNISGAANPFPSGSNGQVLFNSSGTFGASPSFSFTADNVLSSSTGHIFDSPPGLPRAMTGSLSASSLMLYAQNVAGNNRLFGQSGQNGPVFYDDLFNMFVGKQTWVILPAAGGTNPTSLGLVATSTGTLSHPNPSAGTVRTQARRCQVVSAGTSGSVCGIFPNANSTFWRGNAANCGGGYSVIRFCGVTETSGSRAFIGMVTSSLGSTQGSNPTTWRSCMGMGYEDSDPVANGWYFFSVDNGGAFTKIQLSSSASGTAARDGDTVYELHMFAPPSSSFIGVTIKNISSGTIIYNNSVFSSTLPPPTIFMATVAQWSSGLSAVAITSNVMYMAGQGYT